MSAVTNTVLSKIGIAALLAILICGSCNRDPEPQMKLAKWQNAEVWKQMKQGLSEEEVRKLLGDPNEVIERRPSANWYYGDRSNPRAHVVFSNGRVSDWTERHH